MSVKKNSVPKSPKPGSLQEAFVKTQGASGAAGGKAVFFGAVVLLFAVIGLITAIRFGISTAGDIINKTREKEEFSLLIMPLVLQDPPPFDNPEDAADTTIITASVWRLIINEDTSKYPVDEFNFITVPQSDIEVQVKALFGDVEYTHHTVGDTELMITYNDEDKTYIFPAKPYVMSYTPEVEAIQKTAENEYRLTVGYISPSLSWENDLEGNKYHSEPDKIMEYTVVRDEDGQYRVYSVKNQTDNAGEENPSLPENDDVPSQPEGEDTLLEDGKEDAGGEDGILPEETSSEE